MIRWIKEFWNTWRNEIGFSLLYLALWMFSPIWIRQVDPRSGTYDQGILQVIFFTILQFAIYILAAWVFIRFTFKAIFQYFQTSFQTDFKTLKPCEKVYLSLALFCFLLLVLAVLSRVL